MKKTKLSPGRTAQEARDAANRNWEHLYSEALNGNCDKDLICKAMDWCLSLDWEMYNKCLMEYMQKRKEYFIDPDET